MVERAAPQNAYEGPFARTIPPLPRFILVLERSFQAFDSTGEQTGFY